MSNRVASVQVLGKSMPRACWANSPSSLQPRAAKLRQAGRAEGKVLKSPAMRHGKEDAVARSNSQVKRRLLRSDA